MLALPFKDGEVPTEGELRVAKAQLVGWLEGLFHGIQATLFAQQLAARQQLEQMRQLPPGVGIPGQAPAEHRRSPASASDARRSERPGTYLVTHVALCTGTTSRRGLPRGDHRSGRADGRRADSASV